MKYILIALMGFSFGCDSVSSTPKGCLDGKKFYCQRSDSMIKFIDGNMIFESGSDAYNCSSDGDSIFTDMKIYKDQTGQSVLEHGFSKKGNEYVMLKITGYGGWLVGSRTIKAYFYLVD